MRTPFQAALDATLHLALLVVMVALVGVAATLST